jgi:hypothetical protein
MQRVFSQNQTASNPLKNSRSKAIFGGNNSQNSHTASADSYKIYSGLPANETQKNQV